MQQGARQSAGVQAVLAMGLALLAACSSVDSINDKAMLVGPESAPRVAPDPARFVHPAPTEYLVGARDLLEIEIYELEEPNKSKQLRARVNQDGNVLVPLIGTVTAAGRSVGDIQTEITARLDADYLVNPSVSVMVAEHQARRVTVLGAVQTPGTFHLKDNSTTLVDVLALAGGPNDKAGSAVYVVHDGGAASAPDGKGAVEATIGPAPLLERRPNIRRIDLVDLVERGDLSVNCVLEDGDVVHVPPAAQIFVMGQVNQGGAFPLRGEITLLRAIALAGGLKPEATPSATVLIRTTDKGRVTIPIDLTEVEAGSDKDLRLQADDVLVVNESGGSQFTRGLGNFVKGIFHFAYNVR